MKNPPNTPIEICTVVWRESLRPNTILRVPGQFVIGKAAESDIRLDDDRSADQRHAMFRFCDDSYVIEDLNTESGTFLNGHRVKRSAVKDGDEIRCGNTTFAIRFRASDPLTATVIPADARMAEVLTEPEQGDLLPTIQGYEVIARLGQGALGEVYRAKQLGTNRDVAIKCIRPELHADEKVRTLFVREASIATQMKHRSIVDCVGFGFTESRPFLVMEYLPSEDLETIVLKHSPTRRIRLAVKVMLQVLEGLRYAHEKGIVHRDIKLANILAYRIDGKLHVKIADFGMAKAFETAGHSGITGSEELRGTVAYMSPEQLTDSRSAGPDSDLYAAIVCLFRLLTGEFPYPAGTVSQTIYRRLNESPRRVREFNTEVSDDLALIVDSGLSQFAEQRWRSGRRLMKALTQIPEMKR